MKVSVIVTLYKDIEAISLILDALKKQTYKNFEVIIAEDDNALETRRFLESYTGLDIKHVAHPDIGRTKTVIQNKAVSISEGDYLIFIDGDIIPYSTFIEAQILVAKPKRVMSGRRVHLTPELSQKIRQGKLSVKKLEKYFFFYALLLIFDKEARVEQGIYINPKGWIYKLFLSKRKRNANIIGCNWSCYKEDFIRINGFDESYGFSCLGDDTDLDWRFKASGCESFSSKNIANVFHLYHKHNDAQPTTEVPPEVKLMRDREKEGAFVATKGLDTHLNGC
ncbi:glycosyltransferase [Sulfurovum sp.]|uniref:glycosyltransferase n=1 Tax=Sulfurovum sp. TaxID=1969726 RepID=UPI0035680B3E